MATIEDVYRYLGYEGAAGPVAFAAEGLSVEAEVPPLDRAQLEELAAALDVDPEAVVARARALWDAEVTEHELRALIERARAVFDNPTEALAAISADAAFLAEAQALPPGFTFPGIDPAIPITPDQHTFETVGDALGWLLFSGPFLLGNFSPAPGFRWHDDPVFPSGFRYAATPPTAATPVRIALFADFGTGYYHSEYIAKQIIKSGYDAAIHLGDVYYAGRASEVRKRFRKQLDPLVQTTPLWNLNSNHEMQSRAKPYFQYIDDRRSSHPAVQRQEGSYFALDYGPFLVVGIDTEGLKHKRHNDSKLQAWLRQTLEHGRVAGQITILLSGDEPYTYGSKDTSSLYDKDLISLDNSRLIDLWFWGNTHYCALFHVTVPFGFVGSCIGHAGYPFDRQKAGKASPATVAFLEERHRFHSWKLREDMGNNGFCDMTLLHDGVIELRYWDWMANLRCTATLARSSVGGPLVITTLVDIK